MNRLWIALFWVVLVLVVLIRYAEPVGDGDLFWQMAYGKQLLERGTLIPDHTLYSWTPATNKTIYCSWVAEIFFFKVYQLGEALGIGGLTPLFAFRYLCMFGCLALAWRYLYGVNAHKRPESYFLLLLLALSSYVGTILKPEIFSLVCLNLFAYCFFAIKQRAREGRPYNFHMWSLPALMVIWVNSHGVYVFGVVAVCVFLGGEIFNRILSPGLCLPDPALKKLTVATVLTGLATLVNPYGFRYPGQLLNEWVGMLTGGQSAGDKAAYKSLAAHMSIFQVPAFHFVDYMEIMGCLTLAVLAALFLVTQKRGDEPVMQNRIDFSILFLNVIFGFLYTWYLRTTFYWPPFFFYSFAYGYWLTRQFRPARDADPDLTGSTWLWAAGLFVATCVMAPTPGQSNPLWWVPSVLLLILGVLFLDNKFTADTNPLRPRGSAAAVAIGLFFFLTGRASYEAILIPYSSSWFGFGITYWNPVTESEWIEKFNPVDKIYNDYDSGGWLIWKFYPKMKVMIDPRSFPYRDWYEDYIQYEQGQHFAETQGRFPEKPEIAICSLKNQYLWRSFVKSGEWVPAWIGPSSVIFCRKGKVYPKEASEFAPDRFRQVKNSGKLLQVFQFACEIQLFDVAWQALDALRENFHAPEDLKLVQTLTDYKDCILALQQGDIPKAIEKQEACMRGGMFYSQQIMYNLYDARIKQLMKSQKTPPQLGSPESSEIGNLTLKMQRVQQGLMPF